MAKSILTVSAWKLFLAFVAGMIAAEIVALIAAKYFNWSLEYGPYPTLKYGLMTMVLWTYPYLVGRALNAHSQYSSSKSAPRRILLIILLAIVNNTLSVILTEAFGISWVDILITLLVNMYCLVAVLSFPARELKSIGLKRRARLVECWREIIQFTLWPLFVLWLQPMLAFIATEKTTLKKETYGSH